MTATNIRQSSMIDLTYVFSLNLQWSVLHAAEKVLNCNATEAHITKAHPRAPAEATHVYECCMIRPVIVCC